MEFLQTVFQWVGIIAFVVFFFGFCVFIHEFGHLIAALWRGLHVESFSIGFGKKLWGFTHNGIDYKISMLPFGGYVELPQLETAEEWSDSKGNSLPAVSPVDRLITAFAGPFFNILFGLFLGLFVWWFGVEQYPTGEQVEVAWVNESSVEYQAGLREGDVLVKVNGEEFANGWTDALDMLTLSLKDEIVLSIKSGESEKEIRYATKSSENPMLEGLYFPGFGPKTRCLINGVVEDTPAHKGGLLPNDEIIEINGKKIGVAADITPVICGLEGKALKFKVKRNRKETVIGPFDAKDTGKYILGLIVYDKPDENYKKDGVKAYKIHSLEAGFEVKKKGVKVGDLVTSINGVTFKSSEELQKYVDDNGEKELTLNIERPVKFEGEGDERKPVEFKSMVVGPVKSLKHYIIGISPETKPMVVLAHPNPFQQFKNVIRKTWRTVKALVSPKSKVGVKHMSGPIGIAKVLGKAVQYSFTQGLALVAFISFSLAIMNLLPLPVLDGGHITFSIVEIVFRRKLPISFMGLIEKTFAILLISMMLFVTAKDFMRFFPTEVPVVIRV